ncbi:MAG: FimB/Mfa2 family fimbrial subunit [Muribaculaceae bacterium]|nr:FimB/Mfa2 family fimbrial subunit [Muribaculaceae bacterium]MDE6345944.1 FimB/Mfa2 family fimbrial subunit [Muribaculaceae bacterium]
MKLLQYIRIHGLAAAIMINSLMALSSCDNAIYDDEGDCSVTYRLKFRYDMNLKWADAFASEVNSVNVYAFDLDGILVWEKSDSGEALATDGYNMVLDLPAGDYELVAWCGLYNPQSSEESFEIPHTTIGRTTIDELTNRMRRDIDADGNHSSRRRLDFMFHGRINVSLPANDDGGDYTYTMPLTKDTNHIRIILQHLSGEDLDADDFTFTLEDDNGYLSHDNSIIADNSITYRPWATTSGTAGVGKDDIDDARSRAIISVKGAIADFTVSRMMADHKRKMKLTITNDEGEVVARVPVIDYALLSKTYYEEAYRHPMTDQEFLDREDEYVLTFFLDRNNKWLSASILIHSWHIVLSNIDLD